ncbi:protein Wnt-3a-like isoform X2 [Clavelina lepadiformis]|uniref:protein Wnt-3a-like isoform X2 n=1 Tax=Clavelina lepadiformis TaxID=159417 RepID=UPI004041FFA7
MIYSVKATCAARALFSLLVFFIVTSYNIEARSGAPRWWSLAMVPPDGVLNVKSITCNSIPGLVSKQHRYCSHNIELMPSIARGIKLGIDQCKYQLKNRRWNCSTLPLRRSRPNRKKGVFGPVLETASPEAAFVHSIAAAGVAHAVARACAEGSLTSCGCDKRSRVEKGNWRWRGCNEDVEFGIQVSREFADARDQGNDGRAIMNRHNNKAGRMVLRDKMQLKCKCHGLSGSCELRTCWWALPDFNEVGKKLKRMYLDASEMKVKHHQEARGIVASLVPKFQEFPPPQETDLVFFNKSLNFCNKNPRLGIEGTKGRLCNATSSGVDGCDLLCCGRGYNTAQKTRIESCRCVFEWCCHVECEQCVTPYEEHTCK